VTRVDGMVIGLVSAFRLEQPWIFAGYGKLEELSVEMEEEIELNYWRGKRTILMYSLNHEGDALLTAYAFHWDSQW